MKKPRRVSDKVFIVGGPEYTDQRDCCIYLVDGGKKLALIDSGLGFSGQKIMKNIAHLGINPQELGYVIATHGHIDHVGGLYFFARRGVEVVCHERELESIAEGNPRLTAEEFYGVKYRKVRPDVVLKGEAGDIQVGGVDLHCLHTPGHTTGSISVYLDEDEKTRILFGQDIHGPFNTSWGSDLTSWHYSMEKLLRLNAQILCEGHYGTYSPAESVRIYIEGYMRKYAAR